MSAGILTMHLDISPTEELFFKYLYEALWNINQANLNLTAYNDSDWAGDKSDQKSTNSYVIYLGNTLVSWAAKKQLAVARSSTKVECRALASTATEIKWIRHLLSDFGIPASTPTLLLW